MQNTCWERILCQDKKVVLGAPRGLSHFQQVKEKLFDGWQNNLKELKCVRNIAQCWWVSRVRDRAWTVFADFEGRGNNWKFSRCDIRAFVLRGNSSKTLSKVMKRKIKIYPFNRLNITAQKSQCYYTVITSLWKLTGGFFIIYFIVF